jgi:hypothetical protein
VRPVFQKLLKRDPTGTEWLPNIFKIATCNREHASSVVRQVGPLKPCTVFRRYEDRVLKAFYGIESIDLEQCFEYPLPPPKAFLTWLILNPEKMTWPKKNGKPCKYGLTTQRRREELFGYHGSRKQKTMQERALAELNTSGVLRSSRQWWAFEGFSQADCFLETDQLLVLIEGKRTEGLAPSTHWYPHRNQLIRNLEVAQALASGKEFALLLLAEQQLELDLRELVDSGLPHMQPIERMELMNHFLGCIDWKVVCEATGILYDDLPTSTADVVSELKRTFSQDIQQKN